MKFLKIVNFFKPLNRCVILFPCINYILRNIESRDFINVIYNYNIVLCVVCRLQCNLNFILFSQNLKNLFISL